MPSRKVLVVEDEFDLGNLFTEIFQMAGLETELVRDGRNVMERIFEKMPDVIILDMHLPHVSGIQILDQIRANEALAKIKVLVVTADALVAEAVQEKADMALLKPVSYEQLEQITARLMQDNNG